MLLVELPLSSSHNDAANPTDTSQENGNIVETIISLLCGIICTDEQYNKPVGKTLKSSSSSTSSLFMHKIAKVDQVHIYISSPNNKTASECLLIIDN